MLPVMLSRILFIFALSLTACHARAGTILVFGDSLSAGYGIPQDKSWPSLLEARLRKERLEYTVANASVSGETTGGGARRIGDALKKHQPDIVVIELGANDGLRGQNLDVMRQNLETMIDASRKARAEVLLVGMRLPPNYGMAYTEKFQQTFAEVARGRKTAFVPFLFEGFAEQLRYFQTDRVHPTAEAQPLMLETVWKGLKPLLGGARLQLGPRRP
jgi:acyl-CoA thioesterase-1